MSEIACPHARAEGRGGLCEACAEEFSSKWTNLDRLTELLGAGSKSAAEEAKRREAHRERRNARRFQKRPDTKP